MKFKQEKRFQFLKKVIVYSLVFIFTANQAQKHFNPYTSTTVQDKFRKEIVDSKIAQLKQKGNEKVLNEITQRAEKLESISSSRDPNYLHLDKIFSKKIQGLSIGDASKLEFLNTWYQF